MFNTVGIDHLGPFAPSKNGMKYVIVCIDYLSWWVEAAPVINVAADGVISFLTHQVFFRHGVPQRIISDQGSAFKSREFAEFFQKWRVGLVLASAEHPEINGLVERTNGVLVSTLVAFVNFKQDDWDEHMAAAVFSINTAKQRSTEISPFELVYGLLAVLPQENAFPWPTPDEEPFRERIRKVARWRRTAHALVLKSQALSKRAYDKGRKANPIYHPGELVLVARRRRAGGRTTKLNPRFVGPYHVYKRVSATCYAVEDLPSHR